ncbi:MAG: response regulator transcription factor [Balneolaceae bacterium]|nr:response regulator transcription factor [Balneolaceae bacterium]
MSDKSKKILIVEDEPSLVFTLKDTLSAENYEVAVVEDGAEAVETVQQFEPDLMILDLMLPNVSGYDICKEIRDLKYTFPVIMLTAKDQEIDKVTGLNLGADDYITKPFGVKELLARIRARLRRANAYSKSGPAELLKLGDFKIDLNDGKVLKPNQKEEELSTREVEIIEFFLSNANRPISRDDLLEKVWRYEYSTNTRTVDVHISKLRAKIEKNPDDPRFLVTLHGVGYMLRLN